MVNRVYLSLSVLSIVLWIVALPRIPGWVAGILLAAIVGCSIWCEYSRVRMLARIARSHQTRAVRRRNLR